MKIFNVKILFSDFICENKNVVKQSKGYVLFLSIYASTGRYLDRQLEMGIIHV